MKKVTIFFILFVSTFNIAKPHYTNNLTLFPSSSASKINSIETIVAKSEYYQGMVFRETPYSNLCGTKKINEIEARGSICFKLDYDNQNRLIRIKHLLNGKTKAHYGRFVRAPHIEIRYKENEEIRTFYNEYGHRTLVSGNVYSVKIQYDNNGNRKSLKFYNIAGKHIENDFKIATYNWEVMEDATIIEKRYDINNNLQRNRPGFGYFITQFIYDNNGLLRKMINLGESGKSPKPDKAGVVSTKIEYDLNNKFTRWLNLNAEDKPTRGMSNIAEIKYTPSSFNGEQVAIFVDSNGLPQTTNWGVHKVKYEFDSFGNPVSRLFIGIDDAPVNANNGVGIIESSWSKDGINIVTKSYLDKERNRIGVGNAKIHQFKTSFDSHNRPINTSSYDLNGNMVVDPSTGYATEKLVFDKEGRLVERRFLDTNDNLVNHKTWEVARFQYFFKNEVELSSMKCFDSKGKETNVNWNPRH